jgi:hypothetical protein
VWGELLVQYFGFREKVRGIRIGATRAHPECDWFGWVREGAYTRYSEYSARPERPCPLRKAVSCPARSRLVLIARTAVPACAEPVVVGSVAAVECAFPQGYHRVLETLAERIEDPELKANRPRVRTHGHTHHRGTLIRVLLLYSKGTLRVL